MPDSAYVVRRRKLSDYTTDPHNANKGTERGRGMLETSLRRFGAARSLVADRNGVLPAGNKTAEVAYDLGMEDVIEVETDGHELVVVRRRDWDITTDAAPREYAYFDNRVGQVDYDPDLDVLLADLQRDDLNLADLWRDDEIAALVAEAAWAAGSGAEDPGAQVSRAAELQSAWGTARGQVWEVPSQRTPGRSHRVLCGDSTDAGDVTRLMGGAKAEMVWTDPPYGVAIGDKNKRLNAVARSNRVEENLINDTLGEPELAAMLEAAFDCAIQHCIAGAAWYVAAPAGPLHVLFGSVLKTRGILRQTIQWVKNLATLAPLGVDYHWRAEPIFYGWLPNAGHRYYGGRQQDTVWNIDRPKASPEHPTMKPPELVARAIKNSSRMGEVVLDLFCGSGTTLVACEQTGRVGFGMEIAPEYVAVCLQRLADMGLSPVLIE